MQSPRRACGFSALGGRNETPRRGRNPSSLDVKTTSISRNGLGWFGRSTDHPSEGSMVFASIPRDATSSQPTSSEACPAEAGDDRWTTAHDIPDRLGSVVLAVRNLGAARRRLRGFEARRLLMKSRRDRCSNVSTEVAASGFSGALQINAVHFAGSGRPDLVNQGLQAAKLHPGRCSQRHGMLGSSAMRRPGGASPNLGFS